MIQDLHSHTYYSFCGKDTPETLAEAAIDADIDLFGITDHNYGVGCGRTDVFHSTTVEILSDYQRMLQRYFDHLTLIKDKYAPSIQILRGIEVSVLNKGRFPLPPQTDLSYFDYCLVEHLDHPEGNVINSDIFTFAKKARCPVGVAHTDLFMFSRNIGIDPLVYFTRMAEEGIFWEMNVNLDTIHNGHQHEYMLRFFESPKEQDIIRKSGVRVSVGFDGHRIEDYKPERIRNYCNRISEMGIKLAFEP
ncbi:MAG: PHP domain-containing protein [Clostridia bacterium]|nr:PHP domain-containing protein [Clostridia bacterium]